jgi:hypothetical protein
MAPDRRIAAADDDPVVIDGGRLDTRPGQRNHRHRASDASELERRWR